MKTRIGFREAREITTAAVPLLGAERLPAAAASGRVLAADVESGVDSPAADVSMKDGYAVVSGDLDAAAPDRPVRLEIAGAARAGVESGCSVSRGRAVRITTGAALPDGADAVLAEEFAREDSVAVLCFATAGAGRNVLPRGTDVAKAEPVVRRGTRLTPGQAGLLACAGVDSVPVHRRPAVAVISTGDELAVPGEPLGAGKLYASNLTEICAWCSTFGLDARAEVVDDDPGAIEEVIRRLAPAADALVTTGGAWTSEHDLIIRVFEGLGWEGLYHRVRIGPGKGIGFGLLDERPVFCLPGGPPSCELAFLQLALPGIMAMQGAPGPLFPLTRARLAQEVRGQVDWTRFIHAELTPGDDCLAVRPVRFASRLRSMASMNALIVIPEGVEVLAAGAEIEVQDLRAV